MLEELVCGRRIFAYAWSVFEAFEGGIRKDYSTYSYYFVTSGLAFFALLAFTIMGDVYHLEKWLKPLIQAGKNPISDIWFWCNRVCI